MRQVVGFVRAIDRREAGNWYRQLCMQAAVAGGKVTKTFEEMFPEYTQEEDVDVSPEAAKLIEDLAKEQLARIEAEHGRRQRTTHKN